MELSPVDHQVNQHDLNRAMEVVNGVIYRLNELFGWDHDEEEVGMPAPVQLFPDAHASGGDSTSSDDEGYGSGDTIIDLTGDDSTVLFEEDTVDENMAVETLTPPREWYWRTVHLPMGYDTDSTDIYTYMPADDEQRVYG